jgi:hypothetical protein
LGEKFGYIYKRRRRLRITIVLIVVVTGLVEFWTLLWDCLGENFS